MSRSKFILSNDNRFCIQNCRNVISGRLTLTTVLSQSVASGRVYWIPPKKNILPSYPIAKISTSAS